jgi:hypothetical protein
MKKNLIILLAASLMVVQGIAQEKEKILAEADVKSVFSKKFYWGITGNQYWGKIKGADLPEKYFGKPCLGSNLRVEYYPISFIGASIGFGIQQRGAGIITPDKSGGSFTHPWEYPQYDGDSTYRRRLRFNTLEVPITLLLRTPKDVIKGVRLSAAIGVAYVKTMRVNDVFLVVEDGYHQDQVVTSDYVKADLPLQLSLGTDINAGDQGILQVHLVYTRGNKNVFASNQGDGQLITYGFRLSWLY